MTAICITTILCLHSKSTHTYGYKGDIQHTVYSVHLWSIHLKVGFQTPDDVIVGGRDLRRRRSTSRTKTRLVPPRMTTPAMRALVAGLIDREEWFDPARWKTTRGKHEHVYRLCKALHCQLIQSLCRLGWFIFRRATCHVVWLHRRTHQVVN